MTLFRVTTQVRAGDVQDWSLKTVFRETQNRVTPSQVPIPTHACKWGWKWEILSHPERTPFWVCGLNSCSWSDPDLSAPLFLCLLLTTWVVVKGSNLEPLCHVCVLVAGPEVGLWRSRKRMQPCAWKDLGGKDLPAFVSLVWLPCLWNLRGDVHTEDCQENWFTPPFWWHLTTAAKPTIFDSLVKPISLPLYGFRQASGKTAGLFLKWIAQQDWRVLFSKPFSPASLVHLGKRIFTWQSSFC